MGRGKGREYRAVNYYVPKLFIYILPTCILKLQDSTEMLAWKQCRPELQTITSSCVKIHLKSKMYNYNVT